MAGSAATVVLATVDLATVDLATVVLATVDLATVDLAGVALGTVVSAITDSSGIEDSSGTGDSSRGGEPPSARGYQPVSSCRQLVGWPVRAEGRNPCRPDRRQVGMGLLSHIGGAKSEGAAVCLISGMRDAQLKSLRECS